MPRKLWDLEYSFIAQTQSTTAVQLNNINSPASICVALSPASVTGPRKIAETRGYFAIAKVRQIIPDPGIAGMYIALIEPGSYLDFARARTHKSGDGASSQMSALRPKADISRAGRHVRFVPEAEMLNLSLKMAALT